MRIKSAGFTLVEVLVISPIVILFVGTFIALLVNLTGESLVIRERNVAIYDSQAALNDIQSSITQATGFLTTTGALQSPQGKNSTTAAFTDTNTDGGGNPLPDSLILKLAATTKSPNDPTRSLIYTGTGACDSKNPIYTYYLVYFVALDTDTADTTDSALFKRTILPQTAACEAPWQRGSCEYSVKASNPAVCKRSDEKLVGGITTFDVNYFAGTSSSTAAAATDASVNLVVGKQVAGSAVNYNSSVRATSVNMQSSDASSTTPPANPDPQWSRTATEPYRTTISWARIGSATGGYTAKYTIGGGAVQSASISQPGVGGTPSFPIDASYRKQAIVVSELKVVTSAGTYDYGSLPTGIPSIPNWNPCAYINTSPQPSWTSYGSPYLAAGFTKTSAGLVGLRGLVAGGTIGNSICNLPPEFRPSHRLIFQTAGYRSDTGNGWARVDVLPNGNVIPISGEASWVSLDGIVFAASNAGYSWTDNSYQNSWTNWSATYPSDNYSPLRSAVDPMGRVQVQGLGLPGTLGSVVQANVGAARASNPTIHMPSMSGAAASRSIVQVGTSGDIVGRAGNGGYQSYQLTYYPSSFAGWKTLTPAAGWANYGGGWPTLQCYKAADDLVVMRGLVARPSAVDGSVLSDLSSTSPAGGCGTYGDGRLLLSGWMSNEAVARFDIAGNTLFGQFNQPAWNAIDGVHFIAD